jgi:hypothetical protein
MTAKLPRSYGKSSFNSTLGAGRTWEELIQVLDPLVEHAFVLNSLQAIPNHCKEGKRSEEARDLHI